MALTVRNLATGRSVTYNAARWLKDYPNGQVELYESWTQKDGFQCLIATIQSGTGLIIDAQIPCAIREPNDRLANLLEDFNRQLRRLERRVAELTPKTRTRKRR